MGKKQGLGMSPRPSGEHQMVMIMIASRINWNLECTNLLATTETELTGTNGRAADVSVWTINKNGDMHRPVLTVEVVKDKASFDYSYQSIMEVFEKRKTIEESYIYNYVTDVWHRVDRDGSVYEGECYSELLKINMEVTLVRYKQLKGKR